MIIIKNPRYRDRTVLLARYKLPCEQDVTVKITEGAYKGVYKVSNDGIEKVRERAKRRGLLLDETDWEIPTKNLRAIVKEEKI